METTHNIVSDNEFVIVEQHEDILSIDHEIFGNMIGMGMQQHRAIQFAGGTMFFKDADAPRVMNLTKEDCFAKKINGVAVMQNGFVVITMESKSLKEEREDAFKFVIGFIGQCEKQEGHPQS